MQGMKKKTEKEEERKIKTSLAPAALSPRRKSVDGRWEVGFGR
jgi:hypothetical protein